MSRRICLTFLFASFALAAPAASLAQTSSQAQYQGVAPETQTPVGGASGNGTPGGSAAGNAANGGTNGTGGTAASGGGTSGASGNGGATGTGAAGAGQPAQQIVAPQASSATGPFSSGDFVLIVLACAGLTGLGLVLRRVTRREPAGA